MEQIKNKKSGGGVNISHLSKMSNAAKNQMSFPGGMPGPGEYGMQEGMPKIVGKGMMKYMAGEPVGMKAKSTPLYGKKKSTPLYGEKKSMPLYGEKKSMPLYDKKKSMPEYGEGPKKELVGKQENLPEVIKEKIKAATPMYGSYYNPNSPTNPKNKSDYNKKTGGEEDKKAEKVVSTVAQGYGVMGNLKNLLSDDKKIKASKDKKKAAGIEKIKEGKSDLEKAKSQKFISRGSGEDSGVSTRKERRKDIRDARSKKREGRREVRKAKKRTIIKQKI